MSTPAIQPISRRNGSPREIVERAEAFLAAHVDEPVAIGRLCITIGVSERTLRKAFNQIRGMSPKQCAVRARLAGVRRALCHPASDRPTVTAIATDYGFFELGRFAGLYKAAFGENPSATLRAADGHQRAAS
jgi:AraC family ethanolamine operon transcriptional activator